MLVVIKVALALLHLSGLTLFALKYLRFDVRSEVADQKELPQTIKNAIESVSRELAEISLRSSTLPVHDRFVFFLLDAWRWNFLFNERTEMKYLQS